MWATCFLLSTIVLSRERPSGGGRRKNSGWSLGFIEIALGLYCAWSTWLFYAHQSYGAVPFLALCTTGFLTVGILTFVHAAPRGGPQRGSV